MLAYISEVESMASGPTNDFKRDPVDEDNDAFDISTGPSGHCRHCHGSDARLQDSEKS